MFAESHRMCLLIFHSAQVQEVQADIVTQSDLDKQQQIKITSAYMHKKTNKNVEIFL